MQAWREAVIEALRDIADTEAQRAAWVSGEGHQIPDPTELACELFDDTGLWDRLSAGVVFSQQGDEALRRLGRLFETSSLEGHLADVLESREWKRIVALARAALDCLTAT